MIGPAASSRRGRPWVVLRDNNNPRAAYWIDSPKGDVMSVFVVKFRVRFEVKNSKTVVGEQLRAMLDWVMLK